MYPIKVASESIGVFVIGTCRVARRVGTLSVEIFLMLGGGLDVLVGLVGTLGITSIRVFFLLSKGDFDPEEDLRRRLKEVDV